ncbi:MAG: GreA/GreB family elongation factor [Patescibacteria group bacterium]|nr:GreA/GreB family elongation factor [Patescibacteria group bacterium]
MNKNNLISSVIKELTSQLSELKSSYQSARQASNEAPGAMQSHSDTTKFQMDQIARNIEKDIKDKERAVVEIKNLLDKPSLLKTSRTAGFGSLVFAEINRKKNHFFILPGGSGIHIKPDILVVSPPAPVAIALMGKTAGEAFDVSLPAGMTSIKIIDIE